MEIVCGFEDTQHRARAFSTLPAKSVKLIYAHLVGEPEHKRKGELIEKLTGNNVIQSVLQSGRLPPSHSTDAAMEDAPEHESDVEMGFDDLMET
jgi:hypothetical protein